MTKNRLSDVHDHLVAQLERLSDENLKGEALQEEIRRSEAVSKVTSVIVNNANVVIAAERMRRDAIDAGPLPAMLRGPDK